MTTTDNWTEQDYANLRLKREANNRTRERLGAGRWTIEVTRDVADSGKWRAKVWLSGTSYEGLRNVYPATEAANPEWRGYDTRDEAVGAARDAVQCETLYANGIERCVLDAGHAGPHVSPWGEIEAAK